MITFRWNAGLFAWNADPAYDMVRHCSFRLEAKLTWRSLSVATSVSGCRRLARSSRAPLLVCVWLSHRKRLAAPLADLLAGAACSRHDCVPVA